MQEAIDSFLESENGLEDPDMQLEPKAEPVSENEAQVGSSGSTSGRARGSTSLAGVTSPAGTSTWAPEKFSVISWNLDGLDEKNLEKRTAAVVDLIEKDNYSIIFLQELLPPTFHYIASRLESKYLPVLGTENPGCEYLTATFLRLNHVVYIDHEIVKFPGTCMDRNVLVTKAYTGRVKLALLNTHLESTAAFAQERVSQLKTCFNLCKSFTPDWNVIFGGDLNLRDTEVSGNMPASMCDLWIKCGSRPSSKYTWDLTRNTNKQMPSKYQPRCRFDRFYYRESVPLSITPEFFGVTGIEKVTGTQSFPSDHWAIIAFFRLEMESRKPQPKKRKGEPLSSSP
ncbi:unnamed protein product [Allacma fusca]|nr:unnamed protein product [Allacma fusca]